MGSQFELCGKGSLTIDCYASEGIGIGNDYDHGYGDITVDMQGTLEIICNGMETVCIGGGYNDDDSEINLLSGKIKIYMYSITVLPWEASTATQMWISARTAQWI